MFTGSAEQRAQVPTASRLLSVIAKNATCCETSRSSRVSKFRQASGARLKEPAKRARRFKPTSKNKNSKIGASQSSALAHPVTAPSYPNLTAKASAHGRSKASKKIDQTCRSKRGSQAATSNAQAHDHAAKALALANHAATDLSSHAEIALNTREGIAPMMIDHVVTVRKVIALTVIDHVVTARKVTALAVIARKVTDLISHAEIALFKLVSLVVIAHTAIAHTAIAHAVTVRRVTVRKVTALAAIARKVTDLISHAEIALFNLVSLVVIARTAIAHAATVLKVTVRRVTVLRATVRRVTVLRATVLATMGHEVTDRINRAATVLSSHVAIVPALRHAAVAAGLVNFQSARELRLSK